MLHFGVGMSFNRSHVKPWTKHFDCKVSNEGNLLTLIAFVIVGDSTTNALHIDWGQAF
jgi:hypothetical protein